MDLGPLIDRSFKDSSATLAAHSGCRHHGAVPVETIDGDHVAWLCVNDDCGEQLPAAWRPDPFAPPPDLPPFTPDPRLTARNWL